MAGQAPIGPAPDSDAMVALLRQMRRDLDTYCTRPYVNIAGQYRLSVDAAGNLVATHGASGRTQILMAPS